MTGRFLIKNIWMADGTAMPMRKCCCLVGDDGRIAALEKDFSACAAEKQIDGCGMILAPGFIDAHGHSDISALAAPECFSKISQGVTAEVCGNCGLSVFPLTQENREHLSEIYANYGMEMAWSDYPEYAEYCADRIDNLSLIPLCGHNTLRAAVRGYEKGEASAAEIGQMIRLLEQTFKQGACGLSFGLLYTPGCFADEEEISALMRCAARYDKVCTAHLRSEGDELLECAGEMLRLAADSGLKKLHFSHLKTAGESNWGKIDALCDLFEEAEDMGVRLSCDRYPYTESMTQLSAILPGEWGKLDDVTLKHRLGSAEARLKLLQELRSSKSESYWKRCRIVQTDHPVYSAFQGYRISETGREPASAAVEMLSHDPVNCTAAFSGMSEENMKRITALPHCAAGSDGNALPPDGRFGHSHPRSFGAVPGFLRLLLDMGISPEQAVYKTTGLTSGIFDISDFGRIEEKRFADLVIFDPDSIDGKADFQAPERPAAGIEYVFKKGDLIYTSRS